ncbi:hypothetical protein A500_04486 [Clostridium sartagoforme AAU1]|uniref:Phage protein n=1 Tax=Clostridium sartagoforme AAU1 TaxID=1202534 RepID=R9CEM1_9CLOT|nr:head-tail connector protein [Clostridium sartagoforme]EOR27465.1 hypothetical protein A500_04486 [Clostridium sartagoforme AAU1]
MLDKIKIALSIDTEDNYFDDYLETLILASETYIKELIPVEITEELKPRYNITIIALVTYMFNNREMEVDRKSTNKVVKSLLNSLRYR